MKLLCIYKLGNYKFIKLWGYENVEKVRVGMLEVYEFFMNGFV